MAERKLTVDRNMNLQQILKARFENLAADPIGANLVAGRFWFNTSDSRAKVYDGTTVKVVAWLSDFNNVGTFIGSWDASGNTLPDYTVDGRDDPATAAADLTIKTGDKFLVSVASTTALGLAYGNAVVSPGDVLIAIADNPTLASQWIAVETNSASGSLAKFEVANVASLAANTPTAVSFSVLSTIYIVQIKENATGDLIDLLVDGIGTGTITLESNVALGALTVCGIGA